MNIINTPFSYFGSYMSIKYENSNPSNTGLFLKSLRAKSRGHMNVLKIIPLKNNTPIEYTYSADYSSIVLSFDGGEISICFDTDSRILLYGKGADVGLRLDTQPVYNFEFNYYLGTEGNEYSIINSYKNLTKFLVFAPSGKVNLTQNILYDDTGSTSESENVSFIDITSSNAEDFKCVIQDIPTHTALPFYKEYDFEECRANSQKAFESFCTLQPVVDEKYAKSLLYASYINWSSTVKPEGYLRRYTMFASNNYFLGAWSWDHSFNALGLAGVDNNLAFDQMEVLYDYQDELGQIPGSVSDSTLRWNFTKPAVQGLFYSKMMKKIDFTKEQLESIYSHVEKQVLFYEKYKDSNNDGIIEYTHGNDSGQDNSTVFKDAIIIDSPDLTAFLIKSMDTLSDIAKKLNNEEGRLYWNNRADELTKKFIDYFIVDNLPVARATRTGEIIHSNALLPLMSIVLGKRLPDDIRKSMVDLLSSKKYLTDWGIASEAIDSDLYQDDAYWRGPIWAPTTLLLVEAFEDCGETELAMDIARKYCTLINKSGCAENYNAITGEALRDKSFTWTASTFIYLASKLYEYENK